MTPEIERKVRSIEKFGRNARQLCVLIAAFFGLFVPVALVVILVGPRVKGIKIAFSPYLFVTSDHMTSPQIKAWSFIVVILIFTILLWGLFHLHRLFTRLSAGEIYTKDNVRHLRQVGLLAMAMAVLQLLLPTLTFALIEVGFIDRALVTVVDAAGPGSGAPLFTTSLSGFVTAALVLLASWIMDVGRETSDEAAAMRHEADLVI